MSLPGGEPGVLPEPMALAKTPAPLPSRRETPGLSVLVHGGDDPVEPGIATDLSKKRPNMSTGPAEGKWVDMERTAL